MELKKKSTIQFHMSGTQYTVNTSDVSPETTLNTYLRNTLHLTATKKMCLEGGCGVCIVAVEEQDSKGNSHIFAVNSCLVSILSCHGWRILTNEGIGNPSNGYHKIQKLLADNNGSQCGFCSSGMVMNMYAISETGGMSQEEIEKSFGGNLCRCTGYRAILTAFKQLATDAEENIIKDLEDIDLCDKNKCENNEKCQNSCSKTALSYNLLSSKWMKMYKLIDVLEFLRTLGDKRYMLVAGNTARGVYCLTPNSTPEIYLDVTAVTELTSYSATDDSLVLGGNTRLTDTIMIFRKIAKSNDKFVYLDRMADHLEMVAHIPVRNIGTIAGNLMIKYQHNEFPSDVFLILETVKATLVIVDVDENETRVHPEDFLKVDMNKKVIKEIILAPYDNDYYYTSYKITPRAQNAHAMVNAGFLLQLNTQGIVQTARIVYGGINPQFVHALSTENLLKGQNLFDNNVLQLIFKSLDDEIKPDWVLPDPKPEFRKQLALNLFYKYLLSIAPMSKVSQRNQSGGSLLTRPVSKGTQQIYPKKDLYPLTEPVIKLEALAQTSGQAKYILDIPDLPGQLHAVFVKAQAIPGSVIDNIDAVEALKYSGVVAFYCSKDIPGLNSIAVESLDQPIIEEVFCSGNVQHFSQPVGIVVATSHETAQFAASLVKIDTTPPIKKPLFTPQEVLEAKDTKRITHRTAFIPKRKGKDVKTVIKGKVNMGSQYHFHMENQICLAVPTEDGLNLYPGSQWIDHVQGVVSQLLNIASQKINIVVKRLGGGFGAKQTRNSFIAAATALAAVKLQKPVRMFMSLNDNMDIIGKRFPLYTEYEVGVNGNGVIQYLKADLYTNYGIGGNTVVDHLLVPAFQNCYIIDTWMFDTYTVMTDMPATIVMRGPGSFEGIGTIETIMDHIAYSLKLDPLVVRRANMNDKAYPLLVDILNDVLTTDEIYKRKADVEAYNKANRWKKRGLSIIPMTWIMQVERAHYTTLVSIYHSDGGVVISHGGVEIGQGINTKIAQVCAYKFGISLDKVAVKPTYNVISANSWLTGNSITCETIAYTVLKACDILLERMGPIREKNPNASWEELVRLSFNARICLTSNGYYSGNEPSIKDYPLYGVAALELEVDILTGNHEILRVDIVEDVGQSMSPLIDVGQLEGAFVMGLGFHATEELLHDTDGRLVNDRTWNYKVMGALDIPQDFRIRFARNSLNPTGVLQTKAISEPPICLTISFALAIRNALASARQEASPTTFPWYTVDGPSTVEQTLLNTLNDYKQYTL